MNKEWSELNKTMQAQIKKKDTYKRGIDTLLTLRSQLIQTLVSFKEELCRDDYSGTLRATCPDFESHHSGE